MGLATVPSTASHTEAEDVYKKSYTCQSVSLVVGAAACALTNTNDMDVTDPDNANAGPIVGLVQSSGSLSSAGVPGAPALNDPLVVQRFGRAKGQLATSQTITRGDKLGVIAGTGGLLGSFVPGGVMKFVGYAGQSVTTSGTSKFIEVDLGANPQAAPQVVRSVSVSQPLKTTTIGATTAFGATTGTAFGSAAIQLYRARIANEVARNLSVSLGIAPGGSDTVIATLQSSTDNGNTWADRAVTCTITGAAFSATDLVNSYKMAAGEILALKFVSSAGTAAGCCATFDICNP